MLLSSTIRHLTILQTVYLSLLRSIGAQQRKEENKGAVAKSMKLGKSELRGR